MISINPPPAPLDVEITLPGSKSYTNRALIIASIAGGTSQLVNASPSRDSVAMKEALEKLGVIITVAGNVWTVSRAADRLTPFRGTIDVGAAGTTMRFLCALLASVDGCEVRLQGSERMHERPIRDLVEALRALGASIDYLGHEGCPPLLIRGRQLAPAQTVAIDGSKSSQFMTAVMMLGPCIGGVHLTVPGELVSRTYTEMAVDTMRSFGAQVTCSPDFRTVSVSDSPYTARTYQVEADASGASYFWGIAALNRGRVRIGSVNPASVQGDMKFSLLLEKMGCIRKEGPDWIEITGTDHLRGIDCDMELMPDTAQTLAVVAARATGVTRISGLSTLKIKETDRLLALKTELAKCGISSIIDDTSITVSGGEPRHAEIDTYEDHRMAMAFAQLGALPSGITIRDMHVVEKSFPDFWDRLSALGFIITATV